MSKLQTLTNGIIKENPVLVLQYGANLRTADLKAYETEDSFDQGAFLPAHTENENERAFTEAAEEYYRAQRTPQRRNVRNRLF